MGPCTEAFGRECMHCGACASEDRPLLRCSRCKATFYCLPACQRAHWPVHRAQCRAVASPSTPTASSSQPAVPPASAPAGWWKVRRQPSDLIPFRVQGEVESISCPNNPAKFAALLESLETPVLIKDVARRWPALTKWTPEYLAEVVGDVLTTAKVSTTGLFPDYTDVQQRFSTTTKMSIREFAQRSVEAARVEPILGPGEWIYLYGDPLPERLKQDCPLPPFISGQRIGKNSLWWSSQGCCTPCHYDLPHGLLCQVSGAKEVWLFPPQAHDALYPRATCYPALMNAERQSQVDIFHPSLEAFPRVKELEGLRCMLQAGDALLIPSCWWHEVESTTPHCISVNFNFPEVADAILACAKYKSTTTYPTLKMIDVYKNFAQTSGKAIDLSGVDPNQPIF